MSDVNDWTNYLLADEGDTRYTIDPETGELVGAPTPPAPIATPEPLPTAQPAPVPTQTPAPAVAKTGAAPKLDPGLRALMDLESTGGQNKKHVRVLKGYNAGDRAGGSWGLMPKTVKGLIKNYPTLRAKYGNLLELDGDALSDAISADDAMDADLASVLWKENLRAADGDEGRAAVMWLGGRGGLSIFDKYRAGQTDGWSDEKLELARELDDRYTNFERARTEYQQPTYHPAFPAPMQEVGGQAPLDGPADFEELVSGAPDPNGVQQGPPTPSTMTSREGGVAAPGFAGAKGVDLPGALPVGLPPPPAPGAGVGVGAVAIEGNRTPGKGSVMTDATGQAVSQVPGSPLPKDMTGPSPDPLAGIDPTQLGGRRGATSTAAGEPVDEPDDLTVQLRKAREKQRLMLVDYEGGAAKLDELEKWAQEAGAIDPGRLFASRSTLENILSALFVGMGEIGSALTHSGRNPALDMLNNQLAADIDAQKADRENRQNLYAAAVQKFGPSGARAAALHVQQGIIDSILTEMRLGAKGSGKPVPAGVMTEYAHGKASQSLARDLRKAYEKLGASAGVMGASPIGGKDAKDYLANRDAMIAEIVLALSGKQSNEREQKRLERMVPTTWTLGTKGKAKFDALDRWLAAKVDRLRTAALANYGKDMDALSPDELALINEAVDAETGEPEDFLEE